MLVYRQKKLNLADQYKQPELPSYQESIIQSLNCSYASDRILYNELKNQIDIIIQEKDLYFNIDNY